MMKFIKVALLSLLTANVAIAQERDQITTAKINDIMTGLRNTTYVVLYDPVESETNVKYESIVGDSVAKTQDQGNRMVDNHPYNAAIKKAMANWKIGKFEYIRESEFETKRLDPASSFLFPVKVRENIFDNRIESIYLVYAVGSRRGTKADRLPRIASIPIAYNNVSPEAYTWKLPGLVQFIQAHANYVSEKSAISDMETIKYYNTRSKQVKDYTLYVLQEDLTAKVFNEDQIKEIYPGDVQIVNQDELHELLLKQDPNGAFLHKAGPEFTTLEDALCRKYIITMKDGECLYLSEDAIKKNAPEGLLESDLKKLKK